nr:unnamed protein product [Callosobruchus analis]
MESARHVTNQYFVKVNGVDIKLRKTEFLSLHGLQKSSKRVKLIAQQIAEGRTTPKRDGRANITTGLAKLLQKQFSLYMTTFKPSLNYYVECCKQRGIVPIKEDRYRRIFCSDYNIGFKLPKSDTCHTCDFLNNQIEANKENMKECSILRTQLEVHQTRALAMQKCMKNEMENAKNSSKDIISFDLQQTLPTPSLTVGSAFYLRETWTYNLGIHDCGGGQGSMFLWAEPTAKRGSDEIASILLKYLTDNCGGLNKIGLLCLSGSNWSEKNTSNQ